MFQRFQKIGRRVRVPWCVWENILTDFQFELPGSNFTKRRCRYVLFYDEFDPAMHEKRVISIQKTRETAEKALNKRQRKLSKKNLGMPYPDRMGARSGSQRRKNHAQLF